MELRYNYCIIYFSVSYITNILYSVKIFVNVT